VTSGWVSLVLAAALVAFGAFVIRRVWRSWRTTDERWSEHVPTTSPTAGGDGHAGAGPTRSDPGRDPQS
jgi:hypothetical protein